MNECQCADPGCHACNGRCSHPASVTLRRIDMNDETGTDFCEYCADDALESGLFTSDEYEDEENGDEEETL